MDVSFPLGKTVATPEAIARAGLERIHVCVSRHARGDFGVLDQEDRETNLRAILNGGRVMSWYELDPSKPYSLENGLMVVTEADRSVTTTLLPEQY